MPSQQFDDFELVLKELAARTAHRGDVVVAKLDFTANDIPGINRAFPCMLYPKGGGEVPSAYCYRIFSRSRLLSKESNSEVS